MMDHEPEGTFAVRMQDILRSPTTIRDLPVKINLPSSRSLLPALLETGISPEIASAANQIYQQRAEQLKQLIQDSITTACRSAAEFPVHTLALSPSLFMERVAAIFTGLYSNRLREWKEEIIQRTKQASGTPIKVASGNPRTFNQEYIPLLEHFFEENPFPTHADKVFLAKKSNMQYRQIHVWFQNRRNRTKKEGKTLRKKSTSKGATKSFDKLQDRSKSHMVSSKCQAVAKFFQPQGITQIEANQGTVLAETFASSSPPHAFPSSYPPACHYDPFPCKNGPACFAKPEWRRVPDEKRSFSLSTNLDDLIERFSHLNIRDGTRSKGSPKLQSHAATAAITVIPSRAPHPSLIPHQHSQPTNIVQVLPSIRAPFSSKAFQSPGSASKPITLVPPSTTPNKTLGKTAPSPRSLPSRTRSPCHDVILPGSPSTPSSSPRLFSMDSGSRSRSSSTTSLSTPGSDAGDIQELSLSFGVQGCSQFDSLVHLCVLGDVGANSPPSIP